MSVATKAKQAWDTSDYMRIVDARIEGDRLVVLFTDHTRADVKLNHLVTRRKGVYWDGMTFGPYEVIFPTDEGTAEVSWLSIRALSDPAFAAHLEASDKESALQIGRQITQWRKEQRMSVDDLARAAEIKPETLVRVEQGDTEIGFSTLRKILAPLNHSLKDFARAAESEADDSALDDAE